MLEEVTGTYGKCMGIPIFQATRELYLLQLLVESAGGIGKALQRTGDDTDVVVSVPRFLIFLFLLFLTAPGPVMLRSFPVSDPLR